MELHPVQQTSYDPVVRKAGVNAAAGEFTAPARTAAVFVINRPADLSIAKSVALANNPPRPGEILTYTIVITNKGGRAGNVTIGDILPEGLNGDNLN